jgi:hypothetical protein
MGMSWTRITEFFNSLLLESTKFFAFPLRFKMKQHLHGIMPCLF